MVKIRVHLCHLWEINYPWERRLFIRVIIHHFKLTQRLSPSPFDLLEFIFVHELSEGKQHLLIITQGIGTCSYTLFKLEKALRSKWQCFLKASTVMQCCFNSALMNAPNWRLTALKFDFGITFCLIN